MLPTERRHAGTVGLDELTTGALVDLLLEAHADVPSLVVDAGRPTAAAVEHCVNRLSAGGRLVYVASGTPGWLVDADVAELPPTFGVPPGQLVVIRAGSTRYDPQQPDEDDRQVGARRVTSARVSAADLAVAVAASGSTPFTVAAAGRARECGAAVVGVTAVADSPLAAVADIPVVLATGAEPIMGSTRMRAGLAQRLWLTVFSTAVRVRLGRTPDNLLIKVAPVLAKLRDRRVAIVAEATGRDRGAAVALLRDAGDDVRVAVVMDLAGVAAGAAREALSAHAGRTRAAIAALAS